MLTRIQIGCYSPPMNSNPEIPTIPNPSVQLFSGTHLEATGFLCTDLETIQQLDLE